MRRKVTLITIAILLPIIVYLFGKGSMSIGRKDFNNFNKSHIEGTLCFIGIRHHGSAFSIDSGNAIYVFFPYVNSLLNSPHTFESFASVGDSVFKPAYSDTLYLIKSGKIFKYTFQKIMRNE